MNEEFVRSVTTALGFLLMGGFVVLFRKRMARSKTHPGDFTFCYAIIGGIFASIGLVVLAFALLR